MVLYLLQAAAPAATQVITQAEQNVADKPFSLDWGNVLSGLIGAVIGVALTLIAEFFIRKYERNRDKRERQLVTFPHSERRIDEKIFDELSPGHAIELMKAVLGTPNKIFIDTPVFTTDFFYDKETGVELEFDTEYAKEKHSERHHETTAYFYDFKNAQVKITSKNQETIDSLAVEYKDTPLRVPQLGLGWDDETPLVLGESKVTAELVDGCALSYERNMRYGDSIVIRLYTGAPLYSYYTYFGYPDWADGAEPDPEKPETFIGGIITGVCVHIEEHRCYIIRGYDSL
ncbi:MAG: hypothetical protein IPN69_04400 [Acidobacteria bacterium]|nr:hypothetical protein [Acidobacteriota bacterium]